MQNFQKTLEIKQILIFYSLEPKKHSFSISALVGEDSDHEGSQESHDSAHIEEIVDVVSDQVINLLNYTISKILKIFLKFRKITTNINQLNFRTLKSLKPPTRPTQTAATPTRPIPVTILSLTTISAAHSPLTPIPFRSTRSSDFAANSPKLPCATSLRTLASVPKSARHSERLFENCEILKQNYNNCQTSFTNLKLRTALQSCQNQSNIFGKELYSKVPYAIWARLFLQC